MWETTEHEHITQFWDEYNNAIRLILLTSLCTLQLFLYHIIKPPLQFQWFGSFSYSDVLSWLNIQQNNSSLTIWIDLRRLIAHSSFKTVKIDTVLRNSHTDTCNRFTEIDIPSVFVILFHIVFFLEWVQLQQYHFSGKWPTWSYINHISLLVTIKLMLLWCFPSLKTELLLGGWK